MNINLNSVVKTTGKFLDQPNFLERVKRGVPYVLSAGAIGYTLHDTFSAKKEDRKKTFIRDSLVMGFTIASTLISSYGLPTKYGQKLFKGLIPINKISDETINAVKNQVTDKNLKKLVEDTKNKILNPNQIKKLIDGLNREQLSKIIPDPENIGWKKILFEDIKNLSILGFAPIAGGIAGGVLADKINGEDWKEKSKDKIKEGSYQFLANIFLCNVGAGAALLGLTGLGKIGEKLKSNSLAALKDNKLARAASMTAGITAVGIFGGSSIANFLGKNFINPLIDKGLKQTIQDLKNQNPKELCKNMNEERHPELIDVGLHTDDIATVGVMSGFKWIEPSLPILYSVSGFRAGIGYRNGHNHGHKAEIAKPPKNSVVQKEISEKFISFKKQINNS